MSNKSNATVESIVKPVFNKLIGFQKCEKNRLVIVTGDKGGVGKSTFARGILHTYLTRNEIPIVFEADKSNPQIKRFYGNSGLTIEETDVTNANKLDEFIDKLAEQTDSKKGKRNAKILMDLPAQSNQFFFKFIDDMELFSLLENKLQIRTTMVIVFSRVKDCVTQIQSLYQTASTSVDYLIVKNGFFGIEEDFHRYNNSAIRETLFKENNCICEILMPELIEHAFDYIDEKGLTFAKAMESGVKLSVEGRTKGWVKSFNEAIKPALPLLGLKDAS